MQPSILLIEDHIDIASLIIEALTIKGFVLDHACDGFTASHLIATCRYDLIIMDIGLPGIDGLSLCQNLRQQLQLETPVLLLTARDSIDDKLKGFEHGADDYLVKPFNMLELEARIKSQIRRQHKVLLQKTLVIDGLEVNEKTLEVKRENQSLALTPTGFKLLTLLMKSSPSVLSRSDMERHIWGEDLPDSDSLRSHMYQLRKSIDKPFKKQLIRTHACSGYQIVA